MISRPVFTYFGGQDRSTERHFWILRNRIRFRVADFPGVEIFEVEWLCYGGWQWGIIHNQENQSGLVSFDHREELMDFRHEDKPISRTRKGSALGTRFEDDDYSSPDDAQISATPARVATAAGAARLVNSGRSRTPRL